MTKRPRKAGDSDGSSKKGKGEAVAAKPARWQDDIEGTFARICEDIAEGIPLREICRREGMPSYREVYNWMDENPEWRSRFTRAREDGADAIATECLKISEEDPGMTMNGGKDSAGVQHQKLRIETRLKLLAKWFPQKYGEKVEMEHHGPGGGAIPMAVTVSYVDPDA